MHFGNYRPRSFGWELPAASDIVAFSYAGVSFPGGVHKLAAPAFRAALAAIVPHLHGGLKSGQCWGYNHRPVTGGGELSFHAYGLALDINAPDNPYVASGKAWEHTLPGNTGALVQPLGMEWGGDWLRPKDYMHIEIHASPAELANIGTPPPVPPKPGPVAVYEPYRHGARPGSRTVKLYSAGDDVKALQRFIGSKHCGPADGLYGGATASGVRWYQTMRGVPADGICGPVTWHQTGLA